MLAAGQNYPNTCHPRWDVRAGMEEDRKTISLLICRRVANIPTMPRKLWEREGITVDMTEEDLQLLKEYMVDFIPFILL